MTVDELKRYVAQETEEEALVQLPSNIFEIAHALVKDAREEIPDCDQVFQFYSIYSQINNFRLKL